MVYAMISTGFLPGDININSSEDGTVVLVMDQQELMSFEIGAKNRFMGDRLQVNGSAFYYDYEGYQQGVNTSKVINNQLRYAAGYDHLALTSEQLAESAQPYIHEGATWLDDASLSWSSPGGKYGATFYVNNVFDKEYKENAGLVTSSAPYYASLNTTTPRTYGLVLKESF